MTAVTAVTVVINRQTDPPHPFLLDKVTEARRSVFGKLDLEVLGNQRINIRVMHETQVLCSADCQCEAVDPTTGESALSRVL
jgi:hypothetical protein